jgi:septum formation protein
MGELKVLLPSLILASRSFARRSLLEAQGIIVFSEPVDSDESRPGLEAHQAVCVLARRKLEAYLTLHPCPQLPVLACDTLIAFNGIVVGKADTYSEAATQLQRFSGAVQTVHSAWALYYRGQILSGHDSAAVRFRALSEDDIARYLNTGEWEGAAGSYRIQGVGRTLIQGIAGDEAVVIGLPLKHLCQTLSQLYPSEP